MDFLVGLGLSVFCGLVGIAWKLSMEYYWRERESDRARAYRAAARETARFANSAFARPSELPYPCDRCWDNTCTAPEGNGACAERRMRSEMARTPTGFVMRNVPDVGPVPDGWTRSTGTVALSGLPVINPPRVRVDDSAWRAWQLGVGPRPPQYPTAFEAEAALRAETNDVDIDPAADWDARFEEWQRTKENM